MAADEPFQRAAGEPLEADRFRPNELRLDKKDGLRITWADGQASHFPLAHLRQHCPCALCRTDPEGTDQAANQATTSLKVLPANIDRAAEFTDARLIGNYALQIDWADGHKTGIYDFRYLREICPADGPGEAERLA